MTDVYDLIEQHFPYDGPHSAEHVTAAGIAVARLVRYLNNATGPGNARKTLEWAASVDHVLGSVNAAVHGLNQLLRQLAAALDSQTDNPTLYDDRRDRLGSHTAQLAAQEVRYATVDVAALTRQIENALSLTQHLGN